MKFEVKWKKGKKGTQFFNSVINCICGVLGFRKL